MTTSIPYQTNEEQSTKSVSAHAYQLMQEGQFDLAITAYRKYLLHHPRDADALIDLSCILRKIGQIDEARKLLQQATHVQPFMLPTVMDAGKPTLLRLRGFQNSSFTLSKKQGRYQTSLTNGHFNSKNLLRKSDFNIIGHNIYDRTILERDSTPDFDLILNTIACADRMVPELKIACRLVDNFPQKPVINHPANVLKTTREENSQRLSQIDGVRFPMTLRVPFSRNVSDVLDQAQAHSFEFPFIVRPVNTHNGSKMLLVQNRDQLADYFLAAEPDIDYYLIEYIEAHGMSGLFNKMRTFCIDGVFYPIANAHHTHWNVHSGDRYTIMQHSPELQICEQAYLNDMSGYLGATNLQRLEQIKNIIQLDFFGIDFTMERGGSLLIFECNTAMLHHFSYAGDFPYTRPFLETASRAFNNMVLQRIKKL